jgi:hypothetical protein
MGPDLIRVDSNDRQKQQPSPNKRASADNRIVATTGCRVGSQSPNQKDSEKKMYKKKM